MKRYSVLICAAGFFAASLLLMAVILPVSGFARLWLPDGFAVLEGSRLLSGRALHINASRVDRLHWRWCPGQGLATFCVDGQGAMGQWALAATPMWRGLVLRHIHFQGVPLSRLAAGVPVQGRLDGQLNALTLTRHGCDLHSLNTAQADARARELVFQGRSLTDHKLHWYAAEGQGAAGRLRIEGAVLAGELTVTADGRLTGRLQTVSNTEDRSVEGPGLSSLAVNLALPCAASSPAGEAS